uniref:G-protein coupled receptors family 1 profile domain-containing protein n=1 Tax=Meloidogyne javanica TaxID=6303 RepID=A0A915LDW2_MELJA
MYSLCLCIGGPLNLFSFRRLISQIRRPTRQQQQFGSQLLLLKLNLNIADLITIQCTPIWTIIGYELDLKMGTLNESDIEGKLKIFQKFSQVVAWEQNKKEINDWEINNNNSLSTKCETINSNNTRIGLIAPLTIAKARQNAKRQAALILAAYLTFWSPYNLLAICNAWAQKDGTIRQISTITLPFLNGLIVVNPIVNPLIYGVFDKYKLCFTRK